VISAAYPRIRRGSAALSLPIAAVALALFGYGFGLSLAILGQRPAHIIVLFELALFVAADVTLVALMRLNHAASPGIRGESGVEG
jgi:hypothetical protein